MSLRIFLFQSTLPARGATLRGDAAALEAAHFNPRSPHGERPKMARRFVGVNNFNPRSPHGERQGGTKIKPPTERISIHAPRTGSDGADRTEINHIGLFQSTLPARGATDSPTCSLYQIRYFNPRSPHGERRQRGRAVRTVRGHFNPRSPHGERLMPRCPYCDGEIFQSTLPARGATRKGNEQADNHRFQSTLPARGATCNLDF